jgi:predicted Zn-dependent protease
MSAPFLPLAASPIRRRLRILVLFAAAALVTLQPALAQHPRRETLTPGEIEQVRESAIYPVERVKLFTKFLEARIARVKDLSGRPKSEQRALKLDDALQDLTALMDELGTNLDMYSERKSDITKALKPLSEAVPRWRAIVRALPGEPAFDISRKEALESADDLADQASRLLQEQQEYFASHKDEKGQEREDPSHYQPQP